MIKSSNKIKNIHNLENWWNYLHHCHKCLMWKDDYGKDDIDGYAGCLKQNLPDYKIEKCPLTRNQYILINK